MSSPSPKLLLKLKRALPLAFALAAGVVVLQIVAFSRSAGVFNTKTIVAALFVGVVSFPLALGLAWLVLKKPKEKKPQNIEGVQSIDAECVVVDQEKNKSELSKWNYVGATLGTAAILGLFLPKLFSNSLQGKDFIGIGFWMIVVVISGKNILDHLRSK